MTQPTPNKPVDEVRIGRIKATIWRNETEDGTPRYNVVFARLSLQRQRHVAVHTELWAS